ncbi:MAG: DUF5050 domain-containing protein, partial [Clostridia bacterium]|nr:DUF5050 domain-containing protein [Clostridia bacterium]
AKEKVEEVKEVVEEIKDKLAPKKSKKGLIAGIITLCIAIVAAILLVLTFNSGSSTTEGTGNLYAQGFATIKDGTIYHVNFVDYKMYKTDLKTGESTLANDTDFAVYINNYKNDIYYLGYTFTEDSPETVYTYKKYVDGVNDVELFSDVIASPQISDGYIYYLKTYEDLYSGNSSRIYRAKLQEGSTPELFCDVLCSSFLIDGETLYYTDGLNTAFMKVPMENAYKAVTETPLADGQTRSSEEIGAEVVISSVIVACPTIIDNSLFYIDALNQYELRQFDLTTGEDKSFNTGLYATAINIYGNRIYFHNATDYCIYSMNFDGSDITKITAPNYGISAISHDKFMSMEFNPDGTQYIGVCDLDGNKIFDITFTEQYEELFSLYEEELPEDTESSTEASNEEPADETAEEPVSEETSEAPAENIEEPVAEEPEVLPEESIETTVDMEE